MLKIYTCPVTDLECPYYICNCLENDRKCPYYIDGRCTIGTPGEECEEESEDDEE